MTGEDEFHTLAGRGEAAFEVRGSEFFGWAAPATTVDDAEAFAAGIEEEYADATHNVPAYRVRVESGGPAGGALLREYQNDDGEPTGSAGKPALNVLQQREVENAVVVVTRNYGGMNLGVGGLARAYGRAVKEAVDDAGVTTQRPVERFGVVVDYDDSGTIRAILESAGADFEATYDERATFAVEAECDATAALRDRMQDATSGRAEISRR